MKTTVTKEKFRQIFGVYKFKEIIKPAINLFLQTLVLSIVGFTSQLAISLYNKSYHIDGTYSGSYFYTIAKILTVYKIFMFIPWIYSSGVLIVASRLYSLKKYEEIKRLLNNSTYLSLIVNVLSYAIVLIFSKYFLKMSGVKDVPIYAWNTLQDWKIYEANLKIIKDNNLQISKISKIVLDGGTFGSFTFENSKAVLKIVNEYNFAVKYLWLCLLELFIFSIGQCYCSVLTAVNKTLESSISYSVGLVVRLAWSYISLFAINTLETSALVLSLDGVIGGAIQLLLGIFLYAKYNKDNKKKIESENQEKDKNDQTIAETQVPVKTWKWSNSYIKQIFLLGLPISIENGVWYIAQFLLAASIDKANLSIGYFGIYRAINNINDIFVAFVYGMSFLTSSLIAKEIETKNYDEAYKLEKGLFKLSVYAQILFSLLCIALTEPLLRLYSIDHKLIVQIGYLCTFVLLIKSISDIGNLITLRSLWGAGRVWYPVIVSIIIMILLQTGLTYSLVYLHNKHNWFPTDPVMLIVILSSTIFDPLARSISYKIYWNIRYKKIKKQLS